MCRIPEKTLFFGILPSISRSDLALRGGKLYNIFNNQNEGETVKLIHLSDLHLGKRLNEFSLLDDQEHILKTILGVIDEVSPDAVLIAGDVYDKPVPPAEAVRLFDDFLVRLSKRKLQVFVVSGNHDSAERIAFGGRLMDDSGIHMAPVWRGSVSPVTLSDEFGDVNVYMLPFVKPAHVRAVTDEEIGSYTDAVACAIRKMCVDPAKRSVLVTHQFVTGAAQCDSEEVSVGGTDNVDASVFAPFDYVALGHLHRPQNCGTPRLRYCGTPLKYSFSEAGDEKSVTVVTLGKKGDLSVHTVPLTPKRDLREIRGTFSALTDPAFYAGSTLAEDYLRVVLTDEEEIPDAIGKLRQIYQNVMALDYDNRRTRKNTVIDADADAARKTPFDLFSDLYELQNNAPMDERQTAFMKNLIERMGEHAE